MVDCHFDKTVRLLASNDYSPVFADAHFRMSSAEFLVLASNTRGAKARLGIVVAKKQVRLATERNRLKRVIRESFRHHQHELPKFDIVVLVRSKAASRDNKNLSGLLTGLWTKLAAKARATAESGT